jgi:hypothetical protein
LQAFARKSWLLQHAAAALKVTQTALQLAEGWKVGLKAFVN